MRDLALVTVADDENPDVGDLLMRDGVLQVVEGRDAIGQDLSVCLRWFRGDWFLDRRLGLPWFQRVLGIENGQAAAEGVLRRAILSRPGVASLDSLTVSMEERTIVVDFVARTVDGEVIEVRAFDLSDLLEVQP